MKIKVFLVMFVCFFIMLGVNSTGRMLNEKIKTLVSEQAFEKATGRTTSDFESYLKFLEFAYSNENNSKIAQASIEINSKYEIYIILVVVIQWLVLFILPWVASSIIIKIVKNSEH